MSNFETHLVSGISIFFSLCRGVNCFIKNNFPRLYSEYVRIESLKSFLLNYLSYSNLFLILGFVLLFYGEQFSMILSCYCTIKIVGWWTMSRNWIDLKTLAYKIHTTIMKEIPLAYNLQDDISHQDYDQHVNVKVYFDDESNIERFIDLFVINSTPALLSNIIRGGFFMWIGFMLGLWSPYVRSICMGIEIGNLFMERQPNFNHVLNLIAQQFDKKYVHWSSYITYITVNATSIIICLFFQYIMNTLTEYVSAYIGCSLIISNLINLTVSNDDKLDKGEKR